MVPKFYECIMIRFWKASTSSYEHVLKLSISSDISSAQLSKYNVSGWVGGWVGVGGFSQVLLQFRISLQQINMMEKIFPQSVGLFIT